VKTLSGAAAQDDEVLSAINVIPFVDIVLVLLVIFMLTSAAIVKASMKVDLPRAATAGASVPSTVNLVYTSAGELLVNGDKQSLEQAARLIQRQAARSPRTQAIISADRGVEYGRVVALIDLVKQGGITSFALEVERGAAELPVK
jgi:biopolymer transport protein ExbD